MSTSADSAYVRALGERFEQLHPVLQRYFAPLPPGSQGIGHGTFDRVGTPKRWLWPVIYLLQRRLVIWAGWQRDVPFRVVNRPDGAARTGHREFLIPGTAWTMRDRMVAGPDGSVLDFLGAPALLAARFSVTVRAGALQMTSTHVGLRVAGRTWTLPMALTPTVTLAESYDDQTGRQRVAVTITAPIIGRIYEYAGTLTYQIEEVQQ